MYDSIVIGAGFGGLAAALRLAESGKKILLSEALKYPGGCASTFHKNGLSFEAGATLFSGFQKGQLFQKWIQKYTMPVFFESLSPTVLFRYNNIEIPVFPDRKQTIQALCKLPEAPKNKYKHSFLIKNALRISFGLYSTTHTDSPLSL